MTVTALKYLGSFRCNEITLCYFLFILNVLFIGSSSYSVSKQPSQYFRSGSFLFFWGKVWGGSFFPSSLNAIIVGDMLQCENSEPAPDCFLLFVSIKNWLFFSAFHNTEPVKSKLPFACLSSTRIF